MHRHTSLMAALFMLCFHLLFTAGAAAQNEDLICSAADREKAEKILTAFSGKQDDPTARLVAEVGKAFLGIPYKGQTLENGKAERLVVNLREMDCTTFAENCLALALAIRSGNNSFDQFVRKLEKIRYRGGKRDGYLSRLHYFSEWIADNSRKGLVSRPAASFGMPCQVNVSFMSAHPGSYPVLKENPGLVPELALQEKTVSGQEHYWIKKEDLPALENQLAEGDIIGLTTAIPGLDVTHVGILIEKDGRIHLLHASSSLNKVVISDEPFTELLNKTKSWTGIMIARPL